MRMLKHEPSGRIYVWQDQLATVEGMTEFEDAEFVNAPIPVPVPEVEIDDVLNAAAPTAPEESSEVGPGEPARALEEMTRDELIAMAEAEERIRKDKVNLSRMKKIDLIAYITGQGA